MQKQSLARKNAAKKEFQIYRQMKTASAFWIFLFGSCFGTGLTQSCASTLPNGKCRLNVFIRSEGQNDPGITAPGSSVINVGGVDYSPKSQGFNVAVMKQKTGYLLNKKSFDVSAGAATIASMKQFIESLPDEVIILIAVQTTGPLTTPNDVFKTTSANFTAIGSQNSFSAVICKGTGPYCKTKHLQRQSASGPSYLSVSIPMEYPCLLGTSYRVEYTAPIQNRKILGPVLKTLTLPSEKECKNACFFEEEDACYMFNYYGASKTCELLYKDRVAEYSVGESSGSLLVTQKCSTDPCQNGGQCYSLGASSHKACACKTGFTGASCEISP